MLAILICSISSKPFMSGRPRSRTMQSYCLFCSCVQRLFGRSDRDGFDVAVADQFDDALLRDLIILDHQQALYSALDEILDLAKRIPQLFGRGRLIFRRPWRPSSGRAAFLRQPR